MVYGKWSFHFRCQRSQDFSGRQIEVFGAFTYKQSPDCMRNREKDCAETESGWSPPQFQFLRRGPGWPPGLPSCSTHSFHLSLLIDYSHHPGHLHATFKPPLLLLSPQYDLLQPLQSPPPSHTLLPPSGSHPAARLVFRGQLPISPSAHTHGIWGTRGRWGARGREGRRGNGGGVWSSR